MMQGVTSERLKEKIDELEAEAEELVQRNAPVREIDLNRRKVRTLRKWLEEAEKRSL